MRTLDEYLAQRRLLADPRERRAQADTALRNAQLRIEVLKLELLEGRPIPLASALVLADHAWTLVLVAQAAAEVQA